MKVTILVKYILEWKQFVDPLLLLKFYFWALIFRWFSINTALSFNLLILGIVFIVLGFYLKDLESL